MLRMTLTAAIAAIGLAGWPAAATAQKYPDRPVRVIVPFGPGGGGGTLTQIMADYMTQKTGVTWFVDFKPGGGSSLGLDLLAKAKPDGYTLSLVTSDGVSVMPAVRKEMPYKVPDDFTWVIGATTYSYAFAVNAERPYKTLKELIEFAKANPGKLRFATAAHAGGGHLFGALIEKVAGIQMTHVPYSGGGGPAIQGVVGGHVDAIIVTPGIVKPQADAGKLRPLATTDKMRSPIMPDVPTLDQAGLKDLSVIGYYGWIGPAGIPKEIEDWQRNAFMEMLKDPKVIAQIDKLGFTIAPIGGDDFKKFVASDLERWKDVAKTANIILND